MKLFPCGVCGHPLHFENVRCLMCSSRLAFMPSSLAIEAIEPDADGLWSVRGAGAREHQTGRFRLCSNGTLHGICNFAVPEEDPDPYCVACRLTRVRPDLGMAGNRERWHAIEVAKRRLLYTLAQLGLFCAVPPPAHLEGLRFEFLEDRPERPVLTGHANGLITINIAEADDDVRASRRIRLHEPYRTLLGHFRHESGHYYWDHLIKAAGRIDAYRQVFGDESVDYRQSLRRHYDGGACAGDWETRHSVPMPPVIRGRTGPRLGRTTCIWLTCSTRRLRTTPCSRRLRRARTKRAARRLHPRSSQGARSTSASWWTGGSR